MSIELIGAGNGRTGTLSMKLALEKLGYGPCYHMTELMADPSRLHHWQDAFDRRSVDWTALFEGYRSTTDYPGFYFYRDILATFPDAKVILTIRPADEWYESALRTIYTAPPSGIEKVKLVTQLPFNRRLRRFLPVFKVVDYMWDVIFEGRFEDRDYAIDRFEAMNQDVIDTVSPDNLLVFEVGTGWEPLCEFLDVEVPDELFPRTNKRQDFPAMLKEVRKGRLPHQD